MRVSFPTFALDGEPTLNHRDHDTKCCSSDKGKGDRYEVLWYVAVLPKHG